MPALDQFGDTLPDGALARFGTLRWNARITLDLAYSPDGKKLATRCSDFTFRVWDAENGRELQRLSAVNNGAVEYYVWDWDADEKHDAERGKKNALPKFPPRGPIRLPLTSGNLVASLAADKRIRVEGKDTGKELHTFGPLKKPDRATWSPDGSILAVVDADDFSIHLWDVRRGQKLGQCLGHEAEIGSLMSSADGQSFISSAADLTVRCWNPINGKERWKFQGTGASIYSIAMCFSPDGKTLATAGWDGYVYLLDTVTGREREATRSTRDARNGWIGNLVYSPDGKRLYVGTEGASVRECDSATGREIRLMKASAPRIYSKQKKRADGEDWVSALACSADGKSLAMGGTKGICLWNLDEDKPSMREMKEGGITFCVSFSPDSRKLASGNVSLHLWDLGANKKLREIPSPGRQGFRSLAFSPDGQTLATGGWDNVVRLWDTESSKERGAFALPKQLHQVAFSPCGRFIAGLDWYGTVRLWEVAARQDRAVLSVSRSAVQAVVFSPDGRWLALGGSDHVIHVFDLHAGAEIHQFKGHENWVHSLAFSPDGRFLASGAQDSTALVWDVRLLAAKAKRPSRVLKDDELKSAWGALLNQRGEEVVKAIADLVVGTDQSVAFLSNVCPPVAIAGDTKIQRLLRDLDSKVFAEREAAMKQLEFLGERAMPALRKLHGNPPSVEVRRRIDNLLQRMQEMSPEMVRAIRVVEVLEKIGTPSARQLLDTLGQGEPNARLTQDARLAIDRLKKWSPVKAKTS